MRSPSSFISRKQGYLYVVVAAQLWAVSGSAAKFLFSTGISPFDENAPDVIRRRAEQANCDAIAITAKTD